MAVLVLLGVGVLVEVAELPTAGFWLFARPDPAVSTVAARKAPMISIRINLRIAGKISSLCFSRHRFD